MRIQRLNCVSFLVRVEQVEYKPKRLNSPSSLVPPFEGTFAAPPAYLRSETPTPIATRKREKKEQTMGEDLVGLVAEIMIFGIPVAGMYTYYRVRKLRTEKRLAAIARGVIVPMEQDLSQAARSRRAGILLVTGALGYITAFVLVARIEADPEVWCAAAFSVIPMAVGIGYFLDSTLVRHESRAS
jgi:hypothetical protein